MGQHILFSVGFSGHELFNIFFEKGVHMKFEPL